MKKIIPLTSLLLCACDVKLSNTPGENNYSDLLLYTLESSVAELGAQASASESGSEVGLIEDELEGESLLGNCSYQNARSSCSSQTRTINWNSCVLANTSVVLTGGWTETYSGSDASTCTLPLNVGNSVTRKTNSIQTKSFPSGITINTDTQGGTTWDGTTLSNAGINIAKINSVNINHRSVTINGLHKTMKQNGRTIYEHYITTSSPLQFIGNKTNGGRILSSGSMVLYHQLLSYKAAQTFSNVKWEISNCCYPTSGSIQITYTGSKTGTATLAFTGCGTATYTSGQSNENITLNECN
jgi:hypothetical protein